MNAVLIPIGALPQCEPLTHNRPLGDCQVANQPLRIVQSERLQRLGCVMADDNHKGAASGNARSLYLAEDAWLSEMLLQKLIVAAASEDLCIRDDDGRALAWTGTSPTATDGAGTIRLDTGSFRIRYPWDLLRINEEIVGGLSGNRIEGTLSPRAEVEGYLWLGEGSRVLPGVYIEGNVVIGKNCKIGPNCYLRGATSIGDACHIGQAVEIKNSILMTGCSVGHLSYVGDSILGEKVNFGAGTITANLRHDGANHRSMVQGQLIGTGRRKLGVVAGDHVHTGINTSFYPGRKLWPGTGTPPGAIVAEDVREC